MKTETATAQVLAWLKDGKKLTPKTAKEKFGITNLSARISEVRQAGYVVKCTQTKDASGRRVAAYELANPSRFETAMANWAVRNLLPYEIADIRRAFTFATRKIS